jgi:hypothetical protein
MSKINKTLESLAQTFTARDIMVAVDDLITANSDNSARNKLSRNRNLDMIPIMHGGSVSSFLERGSYRSSQIRPDNVISESTNILDLVDLLQSRRFYFIGTISNIKGLIHFSDLNNHLVKLPYFVIFEAFEEHLAEEIRSLVDASNLPVILGQDRFLAIDKKMQLLRQNRADLDWVSLLSFEGIVRCAAYFRKIALTTDQIKAISVVRNRVAHAGEPFIRRHGDIKRLSEAKKICLSVF